MCTGTSVQNCTARNDAAFTPEQRAWPTLAHALYTLNATAPEQVRS